MLVVVGKVHVDLLGLGLFGLEAAQLELHQHDDMIIAQISTECLGHASTIEGISVLVLLTLASRSRATSSSSSWGVERLIWVLSSGARSITGALL